MRKLTRRWITVGVLALLFTAFLVTYLTVISPIVNADDSGTTEIMDGEALYNTSILMFNKLSEDDVQSIETTNTQYDSDGTPLKLSYTFVRNSDTSFVIEDYEDAPYDSSLFATLEHYCTYTASKLRVWVDPDEAKLEEYGLDTPQAWWVVTTTDGTEYKVLIGDELLTDGGYYAMLEGRNVVYVLDDAIEDSILQPVEKYITPTLTNGITSDNYYTVDDFDIYHNSDLFFALKQKTQSEKTNSEALAEMKITEPEGYTVSSETFWELMYGFIDLQGDTVYKLGIDDALLADCGLTDPAYTVSYLFEDTKYTMTFSELQDDGTYFARSSIYPDMIVCVSSSSVGFLQYDLFDWIEHYVFSADITSLSEIDVSYGETSLDFQLYHGTDDDGNATLAVETSNGVLLNSESDVSNFRQYYKVLLSVALKGYVSDDETNSMDKDELKKFCSDDANKMLEFDCTTKTGETTKYCFYQYTTRHAIVTVNGDGQFYVSSSLIEKLMRETDNLLNGVAIDSYGA